MSLRRLVLGMFAGVTAGALLCGLVVMLNAVWPGSGNVLSLPSLLLVPFSIGLAMEALEAYALGLPGVEPCRHRFGGTGFARAGREFAHVHGNGLLDVHLTRVLAEAVVAAGGAGPHHALGQSAWVSFQVRAESDVPGALRLLTLGCDCCVFWVVSREGSP